MADTYDFDAIVVGSGMSGGWAAKELTERGLRVLVLEAGGPIDPRLDYVEHVQPWQMHFRGLGDRKQIEKEQPVQSRCYACDEVGHKFFVNDTENPYTTPDDAPFNWLRGRQVGGRSIMWGRQVYRWSDLDFGANAKDGHGNDWPIRYKDIAPWYEHVERFIGVSGMKEGLPQLPDGIFQKPMELTCVERDMRDKVMKAFNGERVVTIGRVAILTEDHGGRAACHYCGNCEKGCITRSYFSSINATLPAAAATGRLTLRPHSVAAEVLYDAKTGRATGVRIIDAITRHEIEYTSRIVFLNASTIETVRLLLNSKSATFPNGLANSSGTLGRYVMDHNFGAGAGAGYPGFLDRTTFGNRPNGFYIPRFRNVKTEQKDFLRLRVPGRLGAPGMGPRPVDAGLRRRVQAVAHRRAGRLGCGRDRLRRDTSARGEPRDPRPGQDRRLGCSRRPYRGPLDGQRARHGEGHGQHDGRDARGGRLQERREEREHEPAGPLHPRDGRRADEQDCPRGSAQPVEPKLGR